MANTPDPVTVRWPTADPDAPATAVVGELEGYRTTMSASSRSAAIYLDTADWRLRGKGLVLAQETAGGSTRLVLDDGARRVAAPIEAPAWPALIDVLPEGPVRDGVAGAMWIRAVAPVLHTDIRRDTVAVLNDDAKTVVRIDVATATAGDAHITHLTVRPVLGYGADAGAVTAQLAEREGARRSDLTLYEALLAAAGLPPKRNAATFTADTPAAVAVASALAGFADEISGNTAGVIDDVDSEFLHDLRVAVRRTRSMLKLVGDVLPFDIARYTADFKQLGDVTTPTRDLDVYLLEIPELAASLTVGAPEDLMPFRAHIERTRQSALRELTLALRSKRYAALLADWKADLAAVEPTGPTVKEIAAERIRRIYKKVVKIATSLTPESEHEDVHTLRKRCKELRYLLEFFAPVCEPESLKAAVKDLKQLQDILGDFQDGEVQSHGLRTIAEEMLAGDVPPAATLLAMGELSARFGKLQSDARAALDDQLDRYLGDKAHARIEALLP